VLPAVSLWVDRALIAVALIGSCVLFLPSAGDPVNIVKLTLVVSCALLLGAAVGIRALRSRIASVPWGPAAGIIAALGVAFCVSALAAPLRTGALLGAYGRNSGLLAYASALVLSFGALRALTARSAWVLLVSLMAAGAFTAGYGLLQYAGWDPIHWNNPFNPIIASLGNPDFASGYLGICVPAAAWGALESTWARPWRVVAAFVASGCLAAALLSSAVQGPLAAAAGLAVLATAALLQRGWLTRTRLVALLAAIGLLAAGLVGAGLRAQGPLANQFSGISYHARTWYWHGAITMWQRRPLQGVGLDMYGLYWRRDRPIASVRPLGGTGFSDAAHSVPLQHLAEGGLLLAGTYLAFVAVTAVFLVRGLRRLVGPDRMLLGGLGGAWLAYQVQSLVSIDQVPLLVTNFVLAAGVLVVAGGVTLREQRLPGAVKPVTPPAARSGKRGKPLAPRVRTPTPIDAVAAAVLAIAAIVGIWHAARPLRASTAFYDGEVGLAHGNGDAAKAGYDRAVALEPNVGLYRAKLGDLFTQAHQNALALQAFRVAFARDRTQVAAGVNAGRLAEATGDLPLARRMFTEAADLDPFNAATLVELAGFETRHGDAAKSQQLLSTKLRALPNEATLWAALGDALAKLGDKTAAVEAYHRALAIKSDDPTALAGLAALGSTSG
jgi:putative inorganic carbon (HCO3(-)) transporter